ncbi:alpha/beta hydrolase [Alcanivorax sp. 24]|uniref:alpha/beta hydrolase n=1 Tax=Alcanivorax sp. 24 TaxID=2545266 RepID=UPI00105E52AE|nr:alpha/beta fold hydrolase [Alcanivorax sp. 24]
MNSSASQRETRYLQGPAGRLRLTLDHPAKPPCGVVLVGHPQPLLGGSPRHPVPHALARALRDAGWLVVRPSFRGVDDSEGEHGAGDGEEQDTLLMIATLREDYPRLPLALVGFSFGAYVFARAARALETERPVDALVLMGLPVGRVPDGRYYPPQPIPGSALLLHGENDERAPLTDLLQWVRPRQRPVVVFAGTDHFFKGCLPRAAAMVVGHLGAIAAR